MAPRRSLPRASRPDVPAGVRGRRGVTGVTRRHVPLRREHSTWFTPYPVALGAAGAASALGAGALVALTGSPAATAAHDRPRLHLRLAQPRCPATIPVVDRRRPLPPAALRPASTRPAPGAARRDQPGNVADRRQGACSGHRDRRAPATWSPRSTASASDGADRRLARTSVPGTTAVPTSPTRRRHARRCDATTAPNRRLRRSRRRHLRRHVPGGVQAHRDQQGDGDARQRPVRPRARRDRRLVALGHRRPRTSRPPPASRPRRSRRRQERQGQGQGRRAANEAPSGKVMVKKGTKMLAKGKLNAKGKVKLSSSQGAQGRQEQAQADLPGRRLHHGSKDRRSW